MQRHSCIPCFCAKRQTAKEDMTDSRHILFFVML